MYAFRCKNCGHLVASAHAGERLAPRACPVCKAGVIWAGGNATDQPDNWEVLAEATPERLAELGLTAAEVAKHEPVPKEQSVRAAIEVCKAGLAYHEAKRAHWGANKDALVAEFKELDAQYLELGKALDRVENDHAALARLSDERERAYQRMQALANLEPGRRDAEHQAHLENKLHEHTVYLAGQQATAPPQMLRVSARDGARTQDRS